MKMQKSNIALVIIALLFISILILGTQEKGCHYFDGIVVETTSDHMIIKATSKLDRRKFGSGDTLWIDLESVVAIDSGSTTLNTEVRIFYRDVQKKKNSYTVVIPTRIQPKPISDN